MTRKNQASKNHGDMPECPASRLGSLLQVRPGEGRLVTLLLLNGCLVGSARIFTRTSAYALFLTEFDAQALPYVYVGMGLVVALLSFLYLKLSERLPLSRLLLANTGFLLVMLLGFRLGLGLSSAPWLTFALPIYYETLFALTNLAFWNLAGRLFTVRQGKRLFGLVTAGEQAAVVLGGLLVPMLVGRIGTANLLVVAAISIGGVLVLLLFMSRLYAAPLAAPLEITQEADSPSSSRMVRNRYVLLIIALFAASMVSYFVLDNAFYVQAERQYASEQQLASFIGIFFGIAGLLGLLCRTFFTAQLLGRYGVRVALLFQPVLLMLIAVPATLAGGAGLLLVLFWLVASMKLCSAVLTDSIDLPALNITYQPLPAHERVQVQTLTEGIVYALAISAAGITLSISTRLLPAGSIGLVLVLMAILLAWIALASLLGREYPKRLLGAMRRRHLGPTDVRIDDGDTIAVLQRELLSSHPGAVLYAMDTLEAVKPEALIPALPILLDHPIPEVRQEVLQRIERLGLTGALPAIRQRVDEEPLPAVRGFAVRTLAVLGQAEAFDEMAAFLEDPDPHLRQGALVGLLKSGIEGPAEARQVLGQMAGSAIPSERALAARVLGEVGLASLYELLLPLLEDGDPEVERAALWAAAQVQTPRLWPMVLDKLGTPTLVRAAASALVAAGPPVLFELRAAFAQPGQSPAIQARLVEIAGRMGGESVIPWLADQLSHPDAVIRSHVVRALHRCEYRAVAEEAARVQGQIKAEVARSAETWAIRVDLGKAEVVQLLQEALRETLDQDRERVLYLLSFLCDRRAVLQARDNLAHPSAEKQAYAREVIDLLAPQAVKGMIVPLLSDQPETQKLHQVRGIFPQPQRDRWQRLQEIVAGPSARHGAWPQACALYAVGSLGRNELADTIVAALSAPDLLVREMAIWALARLDRAAYRSQIGAMIRDPSPRVARFAGQWSTEGHQEESMLSTVEKVLALKKVDVFDETPDETLAAVAGLLEEVAWSAGEIVFEKGDLGDCMYLVYEGEVRVHDGEHTLNHLTDGDVFGEMALLDAEPRMASVTAVQDTLLLRLAQDSFFELMDDRPEVARGIIRVLSQRLRARARELAELRAQLEGEAISP